jgi:GNAT superfamily N-acetyltransferase
MYKIRLIEKDEIHSIIPLLKLLTNKIEEEVLRKRLNEMVKAGYECVGVYHDEKLIGISGLWTLVKYYVGKHIEPDNVVIHPDYRGKGVGEQMMQWIYEYAKSKGCEAVELNCYVNNSPGQKFWLNQGFRILGFHNQKLF